MADGTTPFAEAAATAGGGAIVVALAGRRYALPVAAVDGIGQPPALCRVPHAAPGLIGAGNLGGQVLPIVDLAGMLPRVAARRYDGTGEVVRLRAAGGDVGLWVDRVERLIADATELAGNIDALDPEPLIRLGMAAPNIGGDMHNPLGDVGELVEPKRARINESFFLVEAAGEQVLLPYEAVLEFVQPPPSVALPSTPAGFLGVGILRGEALPMLSLAVLLGLPEPQLPSVFVVVLLPSSHRVLIGCRSVVGSRNGEEGRHFDPRGALPRALRRIVTGFPKAKAGYTDAADGSDVATFLSFVVDKQLYALPVEAVERVVPPQRLVKLPQRADSADEITGAIELRGQVVPVARLRLSGDAADRQLPGAYVILRGDAGLLALEAERIVRLVALRPEQIAAPPGGEPSIDGVAILDGERDVLRVLRPGSIGSAG